MKTIPHYTSDELVEIIHTTDVLSGVSPDISDRFIKWCETNMHVLEAFERASVLLHEGAKRDRYSVKTMMEKLRWDSLISQTGGGDLKLNNNYASCIARLLMHTNPTLNGMFAVRGRANSK